MNIVSYEPPNHQQLTETAANGGDLHWNTIRQVHEPWYEGCLWGDLCQVVPCGGQTAIIPSGGFPTCQGAARSMRLGWIARDVVISRAIEIWKGQSSLPVYHHVSTRELGIRSVILKQRNHHPNLASRFSLHISIPCVVHLCTPSTIIAAM